MTARAVSQALRILWAGITLPFMASSFAFVLTTVERFAADLSTALSLATAEYLLLLFATVTLLRDHDLARCTGSLVALLFAFMR